MIDAYSSAVSGMNAASSRLADRASRLIQSSTVDATTDSTSGADQASPAQADDQMVNDLAGLGLDKTAFKANVAVLRSARDMEERLLDIIT